MKSVAKSIVSILLLSMALGTQIALADKNNSNLSQAEQENGAAAEARKDYKGGFWGKMEDNIKSTEMTQEEWDQLKADQKAEKKAQREQSRLDKKAERERRKAERGQLKAEQERLKAERKAEKKAEREQRKAEHRAERESRREEREHNRALKERDPKNRRKIDEKFEEF